MVNLSQTFYKCTKNPPAGENAIENLKTTVPDLPENYFELLRFSNGLEGKLNDGTYIVFWPIEELLELNKAAKTEKFAPGLLLIGGNGGDEAIGIDIREESPTKSCYFLVPLVPLGWKDTKLIGSNLENITTKPENL